MRESTPQLIKNNKGEVCGIILEASYCAEQERGITPLLNKFGISEFKLGTNILRDYKGPWGIDRVIVTKFGLTASECRLIEGRETKNIHKKTLLYLNLGWAPQEAEFDVKKIGTNHSWFRGSPVEGSKKEVARIAENCSKRGVDSWCRHSSAAWGEDGFAVLTRDPEVEATIKRIYKALTGASTEKLAVWLGGAGSNPFARDGLVLCFADLADEEQRKSMEESEKGYAKLYWAAEDTGIPKLINPDKYYALKPGATLKSRVSHGKYPETFETAYPIMFFLNPKDQKRVNSGWFTVEELQAWERGAGPIPI